jgi:hypothetical protein
MPAEVAQQPYDWKRNSTTGKQPEATMSHLEARLEHDINKIRAQMAEQSQQVIRAVKDAVHALQTGNKPLAYDTILRDHPINRQMRELDRCPR